MGKKRIAFQRLSEKEIYRQESIRLIKEKRILAEKAAKRQAQEAAVEMVKARLEADSLVSADIAQ